MYSLFTEEVSSHYIQFGILEKNSHFEGADLVIILLPRCISKIM